MMLIYFKLGLASIKRLVPLKRDVQLAARQPKSFLLVFRLQIRLFAAEAAPDFCFLDLLAAVGHIRAYLPLNLDRRSTSVFACGSAMARLQRRLSVEVKYLGVICNKLHGGFRWLIYLSGFYACLLRLISSRQPRWHTDRTTLRFRKFHAHCWRVLSVQA